MSDGCVIDTNVVSYLFRNDTRADLYRPYVSDGYLAISFMTVAELNFWTLQRKWGDTRRERLATFTARYTVILADLELCHTWADVQYRARRSGRPISAADAWIAATAISLDIPLLTHNRRDFAGVDDLVLLPQPTDD